MIPHFTVAQDTPKDNSQSRPVSEQSLTSEGLSPTSV